MDQIMDAAAKFRSALAARKCARTISIYVHPTRRVGRSGGAAEVPPNTPPPTTLQFLKTAVQTFNYTTDF